MLITLFVLSSQNTMVIGVATGAAFIALCAFILIKKTRENGTMALAALAVLISATLLLLAGGNRQNILEYADKEIEIEAHLIDMPYEKNGNTYYTVNVTAVNKENVDFYLRLSSFEKLLINPNDEIKATVKTSILGEGKSNIENYYKSEKLYLSGYISKSYEIINNQNKSLHSFILNTKSGLKSEIMNILPNEKGALLTAMVLGDKSELSKKTSNGFMAAGISHLFVVSGLHITTFCAMVYIALKKLISEKWASILSIIFIVFFVCLTGANPPAVRAGVMLTLLHIGNMLYREADSLNSIGGALILLFINNPYSAVSVSLWLSVFSTVGIICFSGKIKTAITNKLPKIKIRLINKVSNFFISSISISVSVIIITLPIFVMVFNNISLIMIFANLIAVGISAICMTSCGIAIVLLSLGLNFIGNPLIMFSGFISSFLLKISELSLNIKTPLMTVNSNYSKIFLAMIALIIALIIIFKIKNKTFLKTISISLTVAFLAVNIGAFAYNTNNLQLSSLDVGNGISTAIKYKNQLFIILGEGDYYATSSICDIMSKYGSISIDYLIVTDKKAIKDANFLIDSYNVKSVYFTDEKQKSLFVASDVKIINKDVFDIDKNLTIALDKNYLQIYFNEFYSLIAFNDKQALNGAKGNLFIGNQKIPDGININNFNMNIISCSDDNEILQKKLTNPIYTTKDNGSISFIVGKNGSMNFWRTS
ncbi:MAG: ComEC/Rec2 family competence protein [Oscillospiraceae bacterium]